MTLLSSPKSCWSRFLRSLWRPSLVIGFLALLGLFYFLVAIPTISPRRSSVLSSDNNELNSYKTEDRLDRQWQQSTPDSLVPGYLVWSPSCRIPDTDPYHPSLKKIVFREEPVVCSALPPLTSTRPVPGAPGAALRQHVLRLDTSLLSKYRPRFYNNVTCCYSVITRVDPDPKKPADMEVDNRYKVGRCDSLQAEVQLDTETEFVVVRCSANKAGGRSKKVYTNMHAVVAPKKDVRAKLRSNPARSSQDTSLSVLVIGVDSISRLNYFRTMPRTSDYLHHNGWYELRGYNKIEDNTFPNLIAILTGMTRSQLEQICFRTPKTPIDECPLLWRNFSRKGYITAYVEDEPTIGSFNFKKAGFSHAPTDYYLRPFMLAAEDHLDIKRVHRLNACLGPSLASEHILGYASSLAHSLKNHLYFALFWMNSFSHNSVNSPSSMDERFFRFWYDLLTSGALNNTMVIFLSDHGMRFGKIRQTDVGWLEERLPFINIWLPERFRRAYPDLDRGLRTNENRLTTPWDLHVTLKDVLERPWDQGRPPTTGNVSSACPNCSSLFGEVPWNRACQDVSIDPHWCTCNEYQGMSTEDKTARAAAGFVVEYISNKVKMKSPKHTSPGTQCAKVNLNKVISVRSRQHQDHIRDYIIILETLPGKAVFESTIRSVRHRNQTDFELLGSISRINEFWEHSGCIDSAELKKYCHCVKHS